MDFNFNEYGVKQEAKPEIKAEVKKEKEIKHTINFQELPKDSDNILMQNTNINTDTSNKEESVGVPYEDAQAQTHLSLILSPNLRDLEMMIRGLEYVRRYNQHTNREEVVLRRIHNHPLNETGINRIMSELKVYCSPEIKLGRKNEKAYYNSISHVCHSIVRLVYKNLKNFGMDTQEKQRSAKTFANAIIEFIDSSYSRSISGRENDLSRPTELKIEGSVDNMNPLANFTKPQKDGMKN